jgi:hypothetical protein
MAFLVQLKQLLQQQKQQQQQLHHHQLHHHQQQKQQHLQQQLFHVMFILSSLRKYPSYNCQTYRKLFSDLQYFKSQLKVQFSGSIVEPFKMITFGHRDSAKIN